MCRYFPRLLKSEQSSHSKWNYRTHSSTFPKLPSDYTFKAPKNHNSHTSWIKMIPGGEKSLLPFNAGSPYISVWMVVHLQKPTKNITGNTNQLNPSTPLGTNIISPFWRWFSFYQGRICFPGKKNKTNTHTWTWQVGKKILKMFHLATSGDGCIHDCAVHVSWGPTI